MLRIVIQLAKFWWRCQASATGCKLEKLLDVVHMDPYVPRPLMAHWILVHGTLFIVNLNPNLSKLMDTKDLAMLRIGAC